MLGVEMVVIGLTGGIGTGKSEVSRILQGLGAAVIEADKVGHEAYAPQTQGWREVAAALGEGVLQADGAIDRKKLGELVFRDPAALKKLNAILHPKMAGMMAQRIQELKKQGARAIVLEAALLIEAQWTPLVDEVWVTVAPEDVVVRRLRGRNGLSDEAIRARIRAQLPQAERSQHAQVTIENAGDREQLRQTVTDLWETRILARKADDGSQ
jgi:dephospho-CoA kinase